MLVIFRNSNVLVDAVFGWFGSAEIENKWYVFVGDTPYEKIRENRKDHESVIFPDLYKVDIDTGKYQMIAKSNSYSTAWAVSNDGTVIGRAVFDLQGKKQAIYSGLGNDPPLVAGSLVDRRMTILGLGRSSESLLLRDTTPGNEVAREVRLGGPAGGEVLFEHIGGLAPIYDPLTKILIGFTRLPSLTGEDGPTAEFSNPIHQRRFLASAKAFPNLRMHLTSFTSGLGRMVAYTEGAQDLGTYWFIDIAKKSALPIGDARPWIKPQDLGPVRSVSFKASDGLNLDGILTSPPGGTGKPLALIVIPPGTPDAMRRFPTMDLEAQAFASRGYAVFRPNTRGVNGYGEVFSKSATGEVGRKLQSDLWDGVTALAAQGLIDPKRVCIVGGGTYAGYAALVGVTVQHAKYRCAVSHGGIADPTRFRTRVLEATIDDQRLRRERLSKLGLVEGKNLAEVSPIKFAASADAPILLIHEAEDTIVLVEQAHAMEQALRHADKAVEFVTLPGGKDRLSPEAAHKMAFEATVAFVEKHNPAN